MDYRPTKISSDGLNIITGSVIQAAMTVHTKLGPGLLEKTYRECLKYELIQNKFKVRSEVYLPLKYNNHIISTAYRIDLLVNENVIIEVKAVQKILTVHNAQLFTYLKLSGKKVGLLINFNNTHLKNGIYRIVNNFPE